MRRSLRGATLIELLIYGILLLFLMAAVYGAFYMSRLYFSAAEGSTTAQQEAMKGSAMIDRILSDGAAATVEVSNDPPGFRILSARTDQGAFQHEQDGDVLWQQWVCIYLDTETNELRMRTQPLNTAVADPAAAQPSPSFDQLVGDNNLPTRVVAGSIRNLEFPAAQPGSVGYTLTSETESPKFGTNSVQLTNSIVLHM